MRRKPLHPSAAGSGEERMQWRHREDRLRISVGAGVVVRKIDGERVPVVPRPARAIRLPARLGMEEVRRPDAPELPQPEPHVLMVPGGQHAASGPLEGVDRAALHLIARFATVHGEEPQLVEVPEVQPGEDRVPPVRIRLMVPCRDLGQRRAVGPAQRTEGPDQRREPAHVPVVLGERDAALDEDANRAHGRSLCSGSHGAALGSDEAAVLGRTGALWPSQWGTPGGAIGGA